MSWGIRIAKRVGKRMKKFPYDDQKRILMALEEIPNNPYFGDIEKIAGEKNLWRRRVGNYRISYELFSKQHFISILDVDRRTTTTYRKR